MVEFYDRWSADADFPVDRLFGGDIEDLEPTGEGYDPDDAGPWSWDLEADLFAEDLEWGGIARIITPVRPRLILDKY